MSVKKKQMKKKMLFDIIRDFPFAIEGKILTANYSSRFTIFIANFWKLIAICGGLIGDMVRVIYKYIPKTTSASTTNKNNKLLLNP